jgi:hypothetical protein
MELLGGWCNFPSNMFSHSQTLALSLLGQRKRQDPNSTKEKSRKHYLPEEHAVYIPS